MLSEEKSRILQRQVKSKRYSQNCSFTGSSSGRHLWESKSFSILLQISLSEALLVGVFSQHVFSNLLSNLLFSKFLPWHTALKTPTHDGQSSQTHLDVIPVGVRTDLTDRPACFCSCRRSCRRLPSWCSWLFASQRPSIFTSSCQRPKIKHLWTSVRVLPGSTRCPTPPPARKWRWCCPSHLTRRRNSQTPSRLRVPSRAERARLK